MIAAIRAWRLRRALFRRWQHVANDATRLALCGSDALLPAAVAHTLKLWKTDAAEPMLWEAVPVTMERRKSAINQLRRVVLTPSAIRASLAEFWRR